MNDIALPMTYSKGRDKPDMPPLALTKYFKGYPNAICIDYNVHVLRIFAF